MGNSCFSTVFGRKTALYPTSYLNAYAFNNTDQLTLDANEKDIDSFKKYIQRFKSYLQLEQQVDEHA